MATEAFSIHGDPSRACPLLITCEHASDAVPPPLLATDADRAWLATHWGWDPGAGDLARSLADTLACTAVLAGFSRLVCDANRRPEDPTWARDALREHGLQHLVSFNNPLTEPDRRWRERALFNAYHGAIDALIAARTARGLPTRLFSVHSFTPRFDGEARSMELGVLFDREERDALRLAALLKESGFAVALNEPYSGRAGLMYAADRHATAHGLPCLEIEARQDLLADAAGVARVCAALAHALRLLGWTHRG